MRRARLAVVAGLMVALGAAAPVAAATGITSITMGVESPPPGWVAPVWPKQFLGMVVSGSVSFPSQWTIDVTGSATSCNPVCNPPLIAKAEVVVDKIEPGNGWTSSAPVGQQVAAMELPDGHYVIGTVMDDYGLPYFTGPGAGYAEAAYVRALPQHPSGLSYTAIPGAPCGPAAPYVPCQSASQAAPPSTTQTSGSSAASAVQPTSSSAPSATQASGSSASGATPTGGPPVTNNPSVLSGERTPYPGGAHQSWAQCMEMPANRVYSCLYGRFEQAIFRVRWSLAAAARGLGVYLSGRHQTPMQCAILPTRYVLRCDAGARPTAGAAPIRPLVGIARGAGSEQCAVRPGGDAAGRPTLVVSCTITVPAP